MVLSADLNSVSLSANQTNFTTGISLEFEVGPGNSGQLEVGADSVYVTFPAGFILPQNISNSDISINGLSVSGSDIRGNLIAIPVPLEFGQQGIREATLSINSNSGIRNPQTAGSYSISFYTSAETTLLSQSVTISASNTTVSEVSATPSPSVENRRAEYQITFRTGKGGYLEEDDRIYVTFPNTTVIPVGFLSGVTINGVLAETYRSPNNQLELVVVSPEIISNESYISINIPTGAGVFNPSSGTYNLSVRTESENSAVNSTDLKISPEGVLSFSSIQVAVDTVNATTGFNIGFFTGSGGALSATQDIIELVFPENTFIPSNISRNTISIANEQGFSANPTSLEINGRQLRMVTPVNIDNDSEVLITISTSAGIKNPSQPGPYTLLVQTRDASQTIIESLTQSNSYGIVASDSKVGAATITLSDLDEFDTSNHTLTFNTGDRGRLSNLNQVFITYPAGFNLATISGATVNGQNVPSNDISYSGNQITIDVPNGVNIGNNNQAEITLNNVTNAAEGGYTLQVATSAQPTAKTSNTLYIDAESISISYINPSNYKVNATAGFTFGVSGSGSFQKNGTNYLKVTFPEGFVIPATISGNAINLNNNRLNVTNVSVNQQDRSFLAYFEITNGNNQRFYNVNIAASAGIKNPPIPAPGNNNPTVPNNPYRILVSTSEKPVPAQSPSIQIQPQSGFPASSLSVTASPSIVNTIARLTASMTLNSLGRFTGGIAAGSNYIRLIIDNGSLTNNNVSIEDVTVNGLSPSQLEKNGSELKIFMPDEFDARSGDLVEIVLKKSAGFRTVNYVSSNNTVRVIYDGSYSSSNANYSTTNSNGNDPSIFESITVADNRINAQSAYAFEILLGSDNAIDEGDDITLTFPDNTFVPQSISGIQFLVNGDSLTTPAVSNATRSITLTSPKEVLAGDVLAVQISSNAGIINPTRVASDYKLDVVLPGGTTISSPSYYTTATSSSITKANVTLLSSTEPNPAAPNTAVNYRITFNTGNRGRLISGESTIRVKLPAGTNASSASAKINGVNATFNAQNATIATITVPNSISINNNETIKLLLTNVTNPSATSNNYTLDVRTSVETRFVASNPYSISSAGPVTLLQATVFESIVNDNSSFSLAFSLDEALNANVDEITIQLPQDFKLPVGQLESNSLTMVVRNSSNLSASGTSYTVNSDITTSYNANSFSFTTPTNVNAGQSVELIVAQGSGLFNPREPGREYLFNISTSSQAVPAVTDSIEFIPSFATAINGLQVENTVDPVRPITSIWQFTTGSKGALRPGKGTIMMNFPDGQFTIPGYINTTAITINGTKVKAITTYTDSLKITVPNQVTIGNNANITIVIGQSAGIENAESQNKVADRKGASNNTHEGQAEIQDANFGASTSAEPSGVSGESSVLPVELASFTAFANQSGYSVNLQWKTSTEHENHGFMLERTSKAMPNSWKEIDYIDGAGFSTETIVYTYVDKTIQEAGEYLYRLRQTDFDGTEEIYGPVSVLLDAPHKISLKPNYPNPFNPTTTIRYQLNSSTDVRLTVYNAIGQRVKVLVNTQQTAGDYAVNFSGDNLASGIYYVRLQAGALIQTHSMTLIK